METSSSNEVADHHPYEVGSYKLIYAFSRPDAVKLKGMLKVGDATIAAKDPDSYTREELEAAAEKRIHEYTGTANVDTVLEYVASATKIDAEGLIVGFRDYDVHRILINSGHKRYEDRDPKLTGREWFENTTAVDVANAVDAVKDNRDFISTGSGSSSIRLYPHQAAAVDQTLKTLRDGVVDSPRRMLWNAKMRFGKTLAAYSFIEQSPDVKRVLVMTHRPDVNSSWFEDFQKTGLDKTGWRYGSKRNGNHFEELVATNAFGETAPSSEGLVWFASLQDLRLSGFGEDALNKNDLIFSMDWDLVITDEAHEGTITDLAASVYDSLRSRYFLDLSGTPYNILEAGDWDITGAERYRYDDVYHWSYTDEQKAKREWAANSFDQENPYEVFPEIEFRTYNVDSILEKSVAESNPDYRVSELFKIDSSGSFLYEDHVLDLLQKMRGDKRYNSIAPESFPYHRDYEWMFRHTLWILPSVGAVIAMEKLLTRSDSGFGGFKVVNATGIGNEDGSGTDALTRVREAIDSGSPSITLSFRMLTTGISVPEWTAVFMLNNSSNAMAYMQTAFRAATPYVFPNGSQKSKAYIFDFNVERCLSAVVEVAKNSTESIADPTEQDLAVRKSVEQFLEYAPVLSLDEAYFEKPNSSMILEKINEAYITEAVEQGFGSKRILHRQNLGRFDIREIDILKKLHEIQGGSINSKASDIVVSELSEELRDKLKARQEELKKQAAESGHLDPEARAELKDTGNRLDSDKKTEAKNRKNAITILTGILCRLPMLVLAANTDKSIEPGNFSGLIDDRSWQEFMPANLLRVKPDSVVALEERKEEALGLEGSELYWDDVVQFFDSAIFTSACERIRMIAKEADTKDPFERAIRMASMFSFFKNPDKETVLTPWRVVNLQYATTVGGLTSVDLDRSTAKDVYLFLENIETGDLESSLVKAALAAADSGTHWLSAVWLDPNKLSPRQKSTAEAILAEEGVGTRGEAVASSLSEEITPPALPITRAELKNQAGSQRKAIALWGRDDLTIYDINSKTSLYPLYAALSKFYVERLKLEGLPSPEHGDRYFESSLSLEAQQEIWREVVEKNIFLNCRVDYSKSIGQRVLMGFDRSQEVNATSIDVLELKSALEWWNAGGDVEPPKKSARKPSYMPDWWKEVDDVYAVIGATLRLANEGFLRYHRNMSLRVQLASVGYTEERFQKLLETILLSKSQGGELSMGKKADEKSAERLDAVRELLEIVEATQDLPQFDLTAGNPPYQRETAIKETLGQKTVTNVFQEFQLTASEVSVATSLIYPAGRWIQRSGKGLDEFGKNQLNSSSLQEIHVWPDSSEVFADVGIKDGVSIVFMNVAIDNKGDWLLSHWRKGDIVSGSQSLPGESIVALSPIENSIISKSSRAVDHFLSGQTTAQKLFGIESNFVESNMDKVIPADRVKPEGDYIKILANDKAGMAGRVAWYWLERKYLPSGHSILPKWKLVVSSVNLTGFNGRRPYLEILAPDEAHGRSRFTIATFKSEDEAINAARYLNTTLMRYLASTSGDLLKSYGSNVPMLEDYTSFGLNAPLFQNDEEELDDAIFALFEIDETEKQSARIKVEQAVKFYSDKLEATVKTRLATSD